MADLQHQTAVFESEAAARRAYATLTSERGFNCFRRGSEAEVSAYSDGEILKRLKVLQQEPLGSSGEGKRTSVEVESPIGPAKIYIDVAYAHAGRTVMFLKISCGLAPVKSQFFKEVAHLATHRVESTSKN